MTFLYKFWKKARVYYTLSIFRGGRGPGPPPLDSPLVYRRYENRAPVFHFPVIRHTFAEHSIRFCLINLLNKHTRSTIIIERVDTGPYPSFKFYMKQQIFDSYQK